jgi:hypothetical protein
MLYEIEMLGHNYNSIIDNDNSNNRTGRVVDKYCKLILGTAKATAKEVSVIECAKWSRRGSRCWYWRPGDNDILMSCYNFQIRNNKGNVILMHC